MTYESEGSSTSGFGWGVRCSHLVYVRSAKKSGELRLSRVGDNLARICVKTARPVVVRAPNYGHHCGRRRVRQELAASGDGAVAGNGGRQEGSSRHHRQTGPAYAER